MVISQKFCTVLSHVKNTSEVVDCSGSALLIIKNDEVILEEYWGKHSKALDARKIQGNTQFHIASVRKSYIGFTVAYAIYKGYIESIDDLVTKYYSTCEPQLFEDTTLRHLLTHTHGLKYSEGKILREFLPGESWAYRGIGIDTLTKIVENVTGKTVAEILVEQVFKKLNLRATGWYAETNKNLVEVIREPNDSSWYNGKSTAGDERNMYVSARELAKWGSLHLKKGFIDGKQIVPSEIITLATSLQSPESIDSDLPQNGFLWFVKDLPSKKSEIGMLVPKGSYQILGYTGVTLLVIPQHDIVVVRAFNSFGSPNGFDYLSDVRTFGDTVMKCL
ncbi:serine hydrolase domain-containing protein [Sporosarcina sp. E16_8]|uniref:serine hydrolase domain-containing protein n=1 Tax=Sporosarcina sp. E16_8 TaxID=2789295 RepID=UPI001A90F2F7|nr:serine hydrolase domain-containing protein [Sporosarcina sp. E16_8]MBO0588000.1 beta-lactamase family protein [Sporosarcina sp. E16_8]